MADPPGLLQGGGGGVEGPGSTAGPTPGMRLLSASGCPPPPPARQVLLIGGVWPGGSKEGGSQPHPPHPPHILGPEAGRGRGYTPGQRCIGRGGGSPLCDIPSGCCFFTGPWTVTRSSLRMLRWVAAFCRPLRPLLLLVSFPRSRSPVVGVPGLC